MLLLMDWLAGQGPARLQTVVATVGRVPAQGHEAAPLVGDEGRPGHLPPIIPDLVRDQGQGLGLVLHDIGGEGLVPVPDHRSSQLSVRRDGVPLPSYLRLCMSNL